MGLLLLCLLPVPLTGLLLFGRLLAPDLLAVLTGVSDLVLFDFFRALVVARCGDLLVCSVLILRDGIGSLEGDRDVLLAVWRTSLAEVVRRNF